MEQMPFTEELQLNSQLHLIRAGPSHCLQRTDEEWRRLPGQPRVELVCLELINYLDEELLVPALDKLTPWLWLVDNLSPSPCTSD